nr:beta-glucosidase BoGH3B isoform X2 [Ipomoea batatas]
MGVPSRVLWLWWSGRAAMAQEKYKDPKQPVGARVKDRSVASAQVMRDYFIDRMLLSSTSVTRMSLWLRSSLRDVTNVLLGSRLVLGFNHVYATHLGVYPLGAYATFFIPFDSHAVGVLYTWAAKVLVNSQSLQSQGVEVCKE